eukprot:9491362-Pyramimonas_sp.AAC.2
MCETWAPAAVVSRVSQTADVPAEPSLSSASAESDVHFTHMRICQFAPTTTRMTTTSTTMTRTRTRTTTTTTTTTTTVTIQVR